MKIRNPSAELPPFDLEPAEPSESDSQSEAFGRSTRYALPGRELGVNPGLYSQHTRHAMNKATRPSGCSEGRMMDAHAG
jgi:hypothetical protein